jgi:hypothetical protein
MAVLGTEERTFMAIILTGRSVLRYLAKRRFMAMKILL